MADAGRSGGGADAAGSAAGAFGLVGGSLPAAAQTQFSIATGTTGAVYYPLGGAMANILSKKVPGWAVTAEATAQGRNARPDGNPASGSYFRSDHFPLAKRGVPMAYSTVYRMLQTLSYAGLLLPAGTRGRHPCYRPSSAVLNAWQARPSPVSGVGLSGPTSPSA